jgi:isoleucyl-tRNA synthetase
MELNFPKIEEKVLKFWKKNKIFEKSILQRKKAKKFVFYDGPITVNALPGIHHVLARIFKDLIPRFKTMQGFCVERKNGWDTHGLPVELEVEKELGLKTKKDIEKYGIAKFNLACKKNVQKYIPFFKDFTEKIGYWVDMKNPYITYNNDYIETVWWIIRQIQKKGLLYKGYKVVPYCPRCGTSLSSHEVAQGYQRIKEPAIYIKFKVKPKTPEWQNTSILVWTTTPWTLPGNVALAINPNMEYICIPDYEKENQWLVLGYENFKNLLTKGIFGGKHKERFQDNPRPWEGEDVDIFKGSEILGVEYEPLFEFAELNKSAHRVIPADFVSAEEGTGVVHVAPAFGVEDMEVIKMQNTKLKRQNEPEFPILLNVNKEGKFKSEVKPWAGLYVKEADPLIIEDLKKRNLLFQEEMYEHDYPFCWRCNSPLLYYAKESWFINMQKVKKDLIKNNEKINWIPVNLKEGRFGEWLREVKDWALSRERYWGTPLPVWQCKQCGTSEVIGSKEDLLKQTFSKNKYFILRHGETAYQAKKKKIIYDWPGLSSFPLTEKGTKKIKKIVKKLKNKKIDVIYSSDTLRAKQTAKIVANELGLGIHFDPRLRDINLGIYQGREKKEFLNDFPPNLGRFQKRVPGGESWSDIKKRAIDFIKDVDKKHNGKIILVVSHGDFLWLLEGIMEGLTDTRLLKEYKKNSIKPGQLRKIEFKVFPFNEEGELDFHRPFVDEVKFYCPKCENLMERTPEVIDCWFDSGSMPFAQYHYPFENKKLIDNRKQFPADYIAEAIDQTRGWFYTLLAISTLLGFGSPYKNVVSVGHVLDKKGEKMSKSKGNMVDPWLILEKYSADALRWYFFTINQPGDAKLFSEKDVEEKLKKFILIFWNCYLFFETYGIKSLKFKKSKNVLDQWIVSRLNELIQKVTENLETYNITSAARMIENFVVEDLSQWYIRRSREKFQKPESKKELEGASKTLGFVLLTLSKITAPFIPLLSEHIYRGLKPDVESSVHLEDWPKVKEKWIKKDLNEKMDLTRKIVGLGLELRAKAKIKVRQPLNNLQLTTHNLQDEFVNLIKEELNIKEVEIVKEIREGKDWILAGEEGIKIALNVEITLQLKEEGMVREFIRQIQGIRKKAGLKPKDKIIVQFSGRDELNKILIKNKKLILEKVKAKDLLLNKKPKISLNIEREIEINQEKLSIGIKVSNRKRRR